MSAEDIETVKNHLIENGVKTTPVSAKYPNNNQAKYCFALFVKLQYCKQANDDDENAPACNPFSRGVKDICPMQWVEEWKDQVESNSFPLPKY